MDTDSQTANLNTFAVIERLKNNLKELQKQFPEIQSGEDPVSMLEKIPTKLPLINGKLVLVTAFCGPSGAGKSTSGLSAECDRSALHRLRRLHRRIYGCFAPERGKKGICGGRGVRPAGVEAPF